MIYCPVCPPESQVYSQVEWNIELCGVWQCGVEHPDLENLCKLFPKIKYAGDSTVIPDGFQPELLLPGNCCLLAR